MQSATQRKKVITILNWKCGWWKYGYYGRRFIFKNEQQRAKLIQLYTITINEIPDIGHIEQKKARNNFG